MGWLIAGACLLLLAAVLLTPVRYRCEAGRDGGYAEIRLFGGLYRKRKTFGTEEALPEEAGDAAEKMKKEAPLILDEEGRLPSETAEETKENKKDREEEEGSARPGALDVLSFAWDNGTIRLLLRAAGKLYRHSRPKTFLVCGRAGLGDPMKTGVAAGLCYAAAPGCCRVEWGYTERCFDLSVKAEGSVIPLYILYILIRVLASEPVRRTMAYRNGRGQ